jgi:hypothetical protein
MSMPFICSLVDIHDHIGGRHAVLTPHKKMTVLGSISTGVNSWKTKIGARLGIQVCFSFRGLQPYAGFHCFKSWCPNFGIVECRVALVETY